MRRTIKRFLREAGFDVGATKKIGEAEVIKYLSEKQDFRDRAIYYRGDFKLVANLLEEGRLFEANVHDRDLLLQIEEYLYGGRLVVVSGIYTRLWKPAEVFKEALFKIGQDQRITKIADPYVNNVIRLEVSEPGEKIIEGYAPEPIKMSLELRTGDAFYQLSF